MTISPFKAAPPTKQGDVNYWHKLYGASSSLALAEMAKEHCVVFIHSQSRPTGPLVKELRLFSDDPSSVQLLPDWECLPYDRVSPHPDITSQRLSCLSSLPSLKNGLIVAPITTLMQRFVPVQYIQAHSFNLQTNSHLDTDAFRQQLHNAGYYSVDQVMSPGEYAIRGGIIDVFPCGTKQPFRLDLFDTTIESIRLFNPETQRSESHIEQIKLLPAREFPLDENSIKLFRQQYREIIGGDTKQSLIYNEISQGNAASGAEFYFPLFFENTTSLFDFVPENSVFVFDEGVLDDCLNIESETQQRYENAKLNKEWLPLPTDKLFLTQQTIYSELKKHRRIELLNLNLNAKKHVVEYQTQTPKTFQINPHNKEPYQELYAYLNDSKNRILLCCDSPGRRENLQGLLNDQKLDYKLINSWQDYINSNHSLNLFVAELERGLRLDKHKLELICESQLYGKRSFKQRGRSDKNRDPDAIIKSLAELKIDDPVVHEDHGVGRYRGLQSLQVDGSDNEFMVIEYYGNDKVYIPVLNLDRVSRYVGGNPDTAPLHKMGNDSWVKLRNKAKEKAYDVAAELLEVQALRLARKGHAFEEPDQSYEDFAANFEFEETPDQQQVIDDVISDMVSERPMDRLVCGDVGFGKTEIALRAAYMAIAGNKQVVMLVPTTLLAQQHYNNFTDRFADWPVNIELLSRFRTSKETNTAIKGLSDGTVDIAIGTHKLLQQGINFKNLGLMIIDEEHRFGVRQKETLKKLRSQVDILTLTATPIPRTLNFALSGLRDISVIATPPKTRLVGFELRPELI